MPEKPLSEMTPTDMIDELGSAYATLYSDMGEPEVLIDAARATIESITMELRRRDAERQRLAADNAALSKELNDIKWTMTMCGIGDYKTWKQAQDEAYHVVYTLSGEHQAFTEFFAVAKTVAGLLDHGRTAEAIRRLDAAISAEEQRAHEAANPPGAAASDGAHE